MAWSKHHDHYKICLEGGSKQARINIQIYVSFKYVHEVVNRLGGNKTLCIKKLRQDLSFELPKASWFSKDENNNITYKHNSTHLVIFLNDAKEIIEDWGATLYHLLGDPDFEIYKDIIVRPAT